MSPTRNLCLSIRHHLVNEANDIRGEQQWLVLFRDAYAEISPHGQSTTDRPLRRFAVFFFDRGLADSESSSSSMSSEARFRSFFDGFRTSNKCIRLFPIIKTPEVLPVLDSRGASEGDIPNSGDIVEGRRVVGI